MRFARYRGSGIVRDDCRLDAGGDEGAVRRMVVAHPRQAWEQEEDVRRGTSGRRWPGTGAAARGLAAGTPEVLVTFGNA